MFSGDTIYASSKVLEKRESNSRPTQGIVKIRSVGLNQSGIEIISFDRSMLVPKLGHAVDDKVNY